MDFFTVTVSLVPNDVHFQGFLSFTAPVLACDRDDARQEVVGFCKEHFKACSIIRVHVKKV